MIFTLEYGTYTFPNQTFVVTGMPLDMRVDRASIPKRHGEKVLSTFVDGRRIEIKGVLHGDNELSVRGQFDIMQGALIDGEQPLRFQAAREIPCYMTKFGHDFAPGSGQRVANIKAEFLAANPFPRGTSQLTATVALTTVSATGLTVTYGGTVEERPTFLLEALGAAVTTTLTITNSTSGQSMSYITTIPAGTIVIIDAEALTIRQGGVNKAAYLEGTIPHLQPGQNVFSLSGATYQFTVQYYEHYHA